MYVQTLNIKNNIMYAYVIPTYSIHVAIINKLTIDAIFSDVPTNEKKLLINCSGVVFSVKHPNADRKHKTK